MQLRAFLKSGHTPTLFSTFLYFDISFMVWVLLGPLAVLIGTDLHLDAAQKGLMVATPSLAGTFLYFQQANIVAAASDDPAVRTRIFASIDLAIGILTILVQFFATGRLIAALAAQNGNATLLGKGGRRGGQASQQDEGVERSIHARNRRQGLAASQWQVAHLAGTIGGA